MKQRCIFLFGLLFCLFCFLSVSAQQKEKNYPVEIAAVYVFDSNSIELNHTLFEAKRSIFQAQLPASCVSEEDNRFMSHYHYRITNRNSKAGKLPFRRKTKAQNLKPRK